MHTFFSVVIYKIKFLGATLATCIQYLWASVKEITLKTNHKLKSSFRKIISGFRCEGLFSLVGQSEGEEFKIAHHAGSRSMRKVKCF